MMTKKDYIAIAHAISQTRDPRGDDGAHSSESVRIIQRLASVMKDDNPRFDRTTFFVACNAPEPQ